MVLTLPKGNLNHLHILSSFLTGARDVYENDILKPSRAKATDAVRPVSWLIVS
jgi:hypothetical protein